ncbi:MAG: 2OG-Fe(II) oxygenase [Dongiaceae bacterium]
MPPEPMRLASHAPVLILPGAISDDLRQRLLAASNRELPTFGSDGFRSDGFDKAPGDYRVRHDGEYGRMSEIVFRDGGPMPVELDAWLRGDIVPVLKQAFMAKIAGREFWRLARYDAPGGYVAPHRDNPATWTAHRNFTVTVNLNAGAYEGGALRFPEFGNTLYEVEAGSAVVWSAAMLHEVMPVTRGTRVILGVHLCKRMPVATKP